MTITEARPTPPPTLFKYLSAATVANVLEKGTAKFTPMANTNDIFEVRKTFERLGGPRLQALMTDLKKDIVSNDSIDRQLDAKLKERADLNLSRHLRRKAKHEIKKQGLRAKFKSDMNNHVAMFNSYMASEEVGEMFLEMYGKDMLCFSLSESYQIPPMWTHYADGQAGFVIEFSTDHPWFQSKTDPSKSKLHKVTYFDGIVDEFLSDPESAFGSKTTHWAYEREWRMYCGMKDIVTTIPFTPEPIYLIDFPSDVVRSIIVGSRATDETIAAIRRIATVKYPSALLWMAVPNNRTATFDLAPLKSS